MPGSARAPRRLGAGLAASLAVLTLLFGATSIAGADEPLVDGSDPLHRDAAVDIGDVDAVIGGTASASGRWPSVVALVLDGFVSPADRHFCGGTVIAPRWILTAAHCLFDRRDERLPIENIRVIEGVSDLRADPADEEVVVTNAFLHPDYVHLPISGYHDVALLELATELSSPPANVFEGDPAALGTRSGTVVGWGATDYISRFVQTYPDALHEAEVPLVPLDVCNDPAAYDGTITERQLCAGLREGGVDACTGDSGGPLFVDTGERVEQVGVVSYGDECAKPLAYGVYISVSAYTDWLRSYVDLPEPEPEPVEPPPTERAPVEQPRGPTPGAETPPASASSGSGGGGGALSAVASLPLILLLAVRRRALSAALSLGVLGTVGCAHGAALLSPGADDRRVELADQRLGAAREDVLADVSARTGSSPRCTFSKLAPVGRRKAFPLERCEYEAGGRGAAIAPFESEDGASHRVERLVVWFVEGRLVRTDAELAPPDGASAEGARAAVRSTLEARLGVASGKDRWRSGEDVVALTAEEGAARLIVLDGAVLANLPGLVEVG